MSDPLQAYFVCGSRWHDMRPLIDVYPRVERCAWEYPVFRELLRGGLRWAKGEAPVAA